LTKLQKV